MTDLSLSNTQRERTQTAAPIWDQRRWQACPICHGKGIVPQGFYSVTGMEWGSTSTAPDRCRSCDGKGIVR